MVSVLQVLEICLLGLVGEEELECWRLHIDIINFLERQSFTREERQHLTDMVTRWKEQMYQIYRVLIRQAQQEDSRHRKRRKATTSRKRGAPAGRTSEDEPLSLEMPNFEVISHWEQQIEFLGPPWLQSTALWERKHQECKMMMRKTNMRHLDKAVLINVRTHPILNACDHVIKLSFLADP
jgi:hypothetical protein